MRVRVEARGPAGREAMWESYADPSRWSAWAPQIREVRVDGRLRPGLEGSVTGLFGVRASFRVGEVDEVAGRWSWRVRSGPVELSIEHEVGEGRTAVVIEGAAPAVVAYAPVARLALERLVRVPGEPAR